MKAYTSLEQSKKLVELGLDPSTADMHYYSFRRKDDVIVWTPEIGETSKYDIPCWSAGRLIELMPPHIAIGDTYFLFAMQRGHVKDRDTYCIMYYDYPSALCETRTGYVDSLIDACFEEMVLLLENGYK